MFHSGTLTDKLDALIDADDVNEVLNALEGTEYPQLLEDAIPTYKETGILLPLEASLDKYLLEKPSTNCQPHLKMITLPIFITICGKHGGCEPT